MSLALCTCLFGLCPKFPWLSTFGSWYCHPQEGRLLALPTHQQLCAHHLHIKTGWTEPPIPLLPEDRHQWAPCLGSRGWSAYAHPKALSTRPACTLFPSPSSGLYHLIPNADASEPATMSRLCVQMNQCCFQLPHVAVPTSGHQPPPLLLTPPSPEGRLGCRLREFPKSRTQVCLWGKRQWSQEAVRAAKGAASQGRGS